MLIAIDGPAAAGKGTLCYKLAEHFNLARLDTGLIYRAVAKKIFELKNPIHNKIAIEIAGSLSINDMDKEGLRDEKVGIEASKIAAIQKNFAENPPNNKAGAILDGRDIGTIVCPNANFKLFITASPEVRAERRYKELQERGETAIRSAVLTDIISRDERDRARSVSPLVPASDAFIIDTSKIDQKTVFNVALEFITVKSKTATK